MFTVREAANLIGITAGRIRQMLVDEQVSGVRVQAPGRYDFYWLIPLNEVKRLQKEVSHTGRPRSGVPKAI